MFRYRGLFFVLLMSGLSVASQAHAQKRILAHLPSPTGGFTSELLLANPTEMNQSFRLIGFDSAGNQVEAATGTLAPFETLAQTPELLFSQAISHIEIEQGAALNLAVAYQRAQENSGPAHIQESASQASQWRIYPGNNDVTWDGLAAVNTADAPISLTVTQRDATGEMVGEPQMIAEDLPVNAKTLYVVSSNFETVPASYFEISANAPFALIALRGNLASNYLWENNAAATDQSTVETSRLIAHVTSPTGGFKSQVILGNPASENKQVQLTSFDVSGQQIQAMEQAVGPGETLFLDATVLLGEGASHFEIAGAEEVIASMSYQRDRENTGPAQVLESSQTSSSWRVYPGNQAVTWDGLAIVNRGGVPTQIQISQIDGNGSLVRGPITIANDLAPSGKALYLPATDFQSEPDTFFEIQADQELSLMALRGNQASDFIWQNSAVLLPQQNAPAIPPSRIDYAFGYDPVKRVGIMMGGFDEAFALLEDTWIWNGRQWRQVTTPNSPMPRSHHGGAFNTQTGQMIIFGGFRTQTQKRNDFMAFDGQDWQPFPGHPDIPAEDGELIFDPDRNVLVLVVPQGNTLQTWEFQNGEWSQKQTATNPGRRLDQGFVYDPQNQRIIMFGGLTNGNAFSDDTWAYDGQDWQKLAPATSPPALIGMAMYYDTTRQRIVFFGGMNASRNIIDETWTFENNNWRKLAPATSPEARWVSYAVYDPKRDVATIFAGEGNGPSGLVMYRDTWEFDGSTWKKR